MLILFEQVDAQIDKAGLVRHPKKDVRNARSDHLWGRWIEGIDGWWGGSLDRRPGASLAFFGLAARGGNRWVYQSTYGMTCFILLFLRLLSCILDIAFAATRNMSARKTSKCRGPLRDDTIAAGLLLALAEAYLRAQRSNALPASDATLSHGGSCSVFVTEDEAELLYELSEGPGEYVRLDWGDNPPPSSQDEVRSDARLFAAGLIEGKAWKEVASFRFRKARRINLHQVKALFSILKRFARAMPHRRSWRLVIVVDSRVACGTIRKGRSSSRGLNALLRQLAALPLEYQCTVDLLWVPSWADSGDAPSRKISLREWLSARKSAQPEGWD